MKEKINLRACTNDMALDVGLTISCVSLQVQKLNVSSIFRLIMLSRNLCFVPLQLSFYMLCSSYFVLRSCVFAFCPLTGGRCVCGRISPHSPPVPYVATSSAAPHRLHVGEPGPVCRETTHVCIRL